MHKIPPEVLSCIFTLVVENNSFGRFSPQPQEVQSFSLTQVCSRWREVALDTSEIWARFCIRHNFSSLADKNREKMDIKRLRLCIVRAKSYPLFVEIVFEKKRDVKPEDLPNHTVFALLKELVKASNWGGLRIEFASSEYSFPRDAELVCPKIFQMMEDGNLKSLRSLEIHFEKVHDMGVSLHQWRGEVMKFPNLRTLILHHSPQFTRVDEKITFGAAHLIFPYSQLTHVHAHLPCFEETLEVLRLCSQNVRSIHVELSYFPDSFGVEVAPPSISFPFLTSLVVNGKQVKHVRKLLDAFEVAPSLNSLSLSCTGYPDLDNQTSSSMSPLCEALKDFLARSGVEATLQKLRLAIVGLLDSTFPESLLNVLAVTTGVEDLMMSVTEHGNFIEDYWHPCTQIRAVDFLRVLARDDQFLPKLKKLHMIHLDHLRPEETKGSYNYADDYDEDEYMIEGSIDEPHDGDASNGLNSIEGENSKSDDCGKEPEGSKQGQHEWVNEFESAVEWRVTKGLRTATLELESVRGDIDKSDMGLDLKRLSRLRDLGLEIRVLRTRYGQIYHEVLGYGLGQGQSSLFHHGLWIRTPNDRISD